MSWTRSLPVWLVGFLSIPALLLAAAGGPDPGGYYWADDGESGVVASMSLPVGSLDFFSGWADDSVLSIQLPFTFRFYGISTDTVYISDNGWVSFVDPLGNAYPTSRAMPGAGDPHAMIAMFWDDLDPSVGGVGYHAAIANGHQVYFRTTQKSTGQLLMGVLELYQDGSFKIVYSLVPDPDSATFGIENEDGTIGTQLGRLGIYASGYGVSKQSAVAYFQDPGLGCEAAMDLNCGDPPLSSTTLGGINGVESYECSSTLLTGLERTFRIYPPAMSRVTVSLSNLGSRDLHLMLLGVCSPAYGCIQDGRDAFAFLTVEERPYFLVVDGVSTSDDGPFDISLRCEALSQPVVCNGGAVSGETLGAGDLLRYDGPKGRIDLPGPERFFSFSTAATRHLGVDLVDAPDHEVLLVDAAGFDFDAPVYLAHGKGSATLLDAPPGDYYAIVEQTGSLDNTFSLDLTCRDSLPITSVACDTVVQGANAGPSFINGHPPCSPALFDGAEAIYRLDLPVPKDLVITLGSGIGQQVFLYEGATYPAACMKTGAAGVGEVAASGSYLIVVDSPWPTEGDFSLDVQCPDSIPGIPLACDGTRVSGATQGANFFTDHPRCSTGPLNGPEAIFDLTVPADSNLRLDLESTSGHEVFVYPAQTYPDICIAGGAQPLKLFNAAGAYRVVVDSAGTQGAPFVLTATCAQAPPIDTIVCDTVGLAGETSGLGMIDTYSCTLNAFTGPERLYYLDLPPTAQLSAWVHDVPPSASPEILFSEAAGFDPYAAACLASGPAGAAMFDPPAGGLYVIVEGEPGGGAMPYTLEVRCGPTLDCSFVAGDLECNSEVDGDTSNGTNLVAHYRYNPQTYDGPEQIFSFFNPVDQTVNVFLTSGPAELDLFLLDGCDEGAIVDSDDDALVAPNLKAGTYFVVVDGRNGVAGPFSLTVFCGEPVLKPELVVWDLEAGDCGTEEKTLAFPTSLSTGDVILSIDLSGSMGQELDQVKQNIVDIVAELQTLIRDLRFGLVTFNEYSETIPDVVCNVDQGGGPNATPYLLNLPLTNDLARMQQALSVVTLLGGATETYTRTFYEACYDPRIGWRPWAKKIWINFGDEIPQDCNVLECIGGTSNTGQDPGRDEVSGTPDDPVLLEVLDTMAQKGISLLHVDSSEDAKTQQLWTCLTARTGGSIFAINRDGTVPEGMDIAKAILKLVTRAARPCEELKLEVASPFDTWVASITPPSYTDIMTPFLARFLLEICVPPGTPDGTYTLRPTGECDGRYVAEQTLVLRVNDQPDCEVRAAAGETMEICKGESVTLDGGGSSVLLCAQPPEYRWSAETTVIRSWNTDPTVSVTPEETTVYVLDLRCPDDTSCVDQDSVLVTVRPFPLAEAGPRVEICDGDSTWLDGYLSAFPGCGLTRQYQWRDGNVILRAWANDPRIEVTPTADSLYLLEARCSDMPACIGTDTVEVTVKDCSTPVEFGSYKAVPVADGVEIRWITLREVDTLGFLLYAREGGGPAARLPGGLIPAKGPGTGYRVLDRREADSQREYQIVEVTAQGNGSQTPFFKAASKSTTRR